MISRTIKIEKSEAPTRLEAKTLALARVKDEMLNAGISIVTIYWYAENEDYFELGIIGTNYHCLVRDDAS